MVQLRRWLVALVVVALIWLTALMVKSDLSDVDFAQAGSVQPLGAFGYIASALLAWWSLSFLLGVIVGWSTWVLAPARYGDGIVALVWVAFLLLLVIGVADVTPVRVDFWLEAALLFFFVYWLGCGLGWALRCMAMMHAHESLAKRAKSRSSGSRHGLLSRSAEGASDAPMIPALTAASSPTQGRDAEITSPAANPVADPAVVGSTTDSTVPTSAARAPAASVIEQPAHDVAATRPPADVTAAEDPAGSAAFVSSPRTPSTEDATAVQRETPGEPGWSRPAETPSNPEPPNSIEAVEASDAMTRLAQAAGPGAEGTVLLGPESVDPAFVPAVGRAAGKSNVVPDGRPSGRLLDLNDADAAASVSRVGPATEAEALAAPGSNVVKPAPGGEKHPGHQPQGLVAPRDERPDDLKLIRGIGPQNEKRLNGLGVFHFDQIAAWTPENALWIGSYLAFPGRIQREQWIVQAVDLAAGRGTPTKRTAGRKTEV